MIIKEVEFSEEDKSKLVNELCSLAEKESRCYEKNGYEILYPFSDQIWVFAKILIDDDLYGKKPSRHTSTDINVFQSESMDFVKSNLNYEFEDRINKALIQEFNRRY